MCMIGYFVKMVRVPKSRPLTGYRGWLFVSWKGQRGTLWPYAYDDKPWRKTHRADAAPTPDNEHGLWANSGRNAIPACSVYGVVKVWGMVAVHTKGFRATHARIVSLDRDRGTAAEPEIKVAARRYKVRVKALPKQKVRAR